MRWRILGPVEVTAGGRPVHLRPQERAIVAYLLLNANHVVSIEQIVDAVWGDNPPSSARTQVHGCVSKVRRALRAARLDDSLTSQSGGYRMGVTDSEFDLAAFTAQVAKARAAESALSRVALLRAALELWSGTPLAGAAGGFVSTAVAGLSEKQLAAYEELFDDELSLGRHGALVAELRALVQVHPLRERLVAQLMLALAGSGQQAAALRIYAQTRRRLADELGVEPTAALASVHLRVLRQQMPAPAQPASAPARPVPAQLPADNAAFAGRATQVRQLDLLLGMADGRHQAVVISAIDGTAGVGKTALAVHWAHRVADRFPDGQLYVNLRGFDPASRPMEPAEALRSFVIALQAPAMHIPSGLDDQAALYRSLLAGRRMLILLDNARDAEQVRPLLPGASGCFVLVTSRHQLTGLVAREGAHPLTLDTLSTLEAKALLARRLGTARVDAEPDAVQSIIEHCARLPLALAVVAARAATTAWLSLATLAEQLRGCRDSLDNFHTADPATDIRAVFSWSYRELTPAAAMMFRLQGLIPGPDISAPAAASLAGQPMDTAGSLLAELVRANLLTEQTPGRYALHDLLRAYAAEQARVHCDEQSRRVATHRLLDHYLRSTLVADRALDPHRDEIGVAPPHPGVVVAEPATVEQALTWLTAEYPSLLAAVRHAARCGFDGHAWQLAWLLGSFLDRHGLWQDWIDLHTVALEAVERLGDRAALARIHRDLARAYGKSGGHDSARMHLHRALRLFAESGDIQAQAATHLNLGGLAGRQERYADALEHARQALLLFREVGHRRGQAKALNNIGWYHSQLGEHAAALVHCGQALELLHEIGDLRSAADAWDSLAFAHLHLHDHAAAISCYRQALQLYREVGDRYAEGCTLVDLGDAHDTAGDRPAAFATWQQALLVLEEIEHSRATAVRAKLRHAEASLS